jgi:Ca2+-binding RTX toxin-like protein
MLSADVLLNDSDPDGQTLTARLLAGPANGTVALQPDGRFSYTPRPDFNGADRFTYAASDGSLDATATVSISVAGIVDEIFGTALDDELLDSSGEARLYGLAGNDRLQGGADDDRLDGGAGTDTAVYVRAAADYALARIGANWRVTDRVGDEGTDTLVAIERLRFADKSVALDLDGAAGSTAKLIGAIFGEAHLLPAYVGIGISLFDGGWSSAEVAGFALETALYAELAGSRSNADFVRRVYTNVVGHEPSAAEQAHYQGILDRGEMTQAQLAIFAAETAENAASIDFVGLASSGIEFVPFGP